MTRVEAEVIIRATLSLVEAAEKLAKDTGTDTVSVVSGNYRVAGRRTAPELEKLRALTRKLLADNPWFRP